MSKWSIVSSLGCLILGVGSVLVPVCAGWTPWVIKTKSELANPAVVSSLRPLGSHGLTLYLDFDESVEKTYVSSYHLSAGICDPSDWDDWIIITYRNFPSALAATRRIVYAATHTPEMDKDEVDEPVFP